MDTSTSLTESDYGLFSQQNPKRHYWQYLLIISLFLSFPVLQFTLFQETDSIGVYHPNGTLWENPLGEYEVKNERCFFNNKCRHRLGIIEAFNNVISNIMYVLLGLVFIITVALSSKADTGCGIHRDHSIYYTMGLCLIMIGMFSAFYHVCPSPVNFQFDTLYMFISGAISFMAIYYKRHRNKIPSAFKTYLILGTINFLSSLSLIKYQSQTVGIWVWFIADLIIFYVLLHGSINIYYASDWDFDIHLFRKIYYSVKDTSGFTNWTKLIYVSLVNIFAITIILYATFSHKTVFTNWFLFMIIFNMGFYFTYYLVQKIRHKENIKLGFWIAILADLGILATAMIFFQHGVTNKFKTHKESDALNEPCILFDYFDTHDVWHVLSAIGLYIFMNIVYFIDDDLKQTPRNQIAVF